MRTFPEKRFFDWEEDDIAVTLRSSGGSYGGGSEVLILFTQRQSEPCAQETIKESAMNMLPKESW